ncbi:MAG: hypothetical protein COX80_01440 [Candidatus Magasanikbacteria bacterium CG_4_10_14_0_2_um_filter_33_14]|uniref:Thioredoxin domain-containing protein n=1 Tax=Candidatus Magasanikbacteria bacterium CG_4_10_14_0_2_um_filter_33_14 TaxID=1974636 RepID=A0A2M7VBG2_9BACT|nr:MAG: hypothetical protein COX80_01440 [Candidatus Magasanikbacteria bacterium CG_4_10_14_0_2_um_filter_33_14]
MDEQNTQKSIFEVMNPKQTFEFGLVGGVMLLCTIGFFILIGIFLKGTNGASVTYDTSDNNIAVNTAGADTAIANPEAPANITLAAVTDQDYIRGAKDAPITIVEYSDPECPFCKRFHQTMQEVMKEYDGKVNWVYRQFPLVSLHSKAPKEAEAIECAGDLGGNAKHWDYLDKLFEITPSNNGLDLAQLPKIATGIGLNKTKFEDCLNSGKFTNKIQKSTAEAQAAGAQGTPYSIMLVGDQKIVINGAQPLSQIKSMIDSALQQL